jgi:hypothetical protein
MSDFTNPYSQLYPKKVADVILNYENDFREKVSTNIYIDNKFYFEKLILDVKQAYLDENLSEYQFSFQLEEIIQNFHQRNRKYLLDNFCNDLTDIIPIELEEFNSVPTLEDFVILNDSNDLEDEKNEENKDKSNDINTKTDIDIFFTILHSMGRFIKKDSVDIKNLIIYIVKFSVLRKKIIKELSSNPEDKQLINELNIDKLDDKYISRQILNTIESDRDIEILTKNNTFYSLKYFKF